jgi:hypothetical protein
VGATSGAKWGAMTVSFTTWTAPRGRP